MLEESKMDKKSINRSQLQSRASAVDGKKSTELTHKPWPRNNKKREGAGGAPKNEPNRKNVPAQRGRGQIDRRPRARGPSNYAICGAEIARLGDDEDPEIGLEYMPRSKKQNWNHLLNFMYTPRGGMDRRDPVPRRQGVQRAPQRHSHDLYLRAYCQFVVKEDGDYRANILDPDVPIKWEQIEEIVVRSTGRTECPICLGAPVAGRAGLCGHVYCWACALHYAAAHARRPPPCPVCHAPLHVTDMKPTRMVQWEQPAEEISMRLVRRLRGSTAVEAAPPRGLARAAAAAAAAAVLPLHNINDAPYAKFFAANKQQVHDILKRERKEIEDQILAEIDTTEIVFMEEALALLKAKEESINQQYNVTKIKEEVLDEAPTVYEKQEDQDRVDWFDVNEEGAACIDVIQEQLQKLEVSNVESSLNPDALEFSLDDLNGSQAEEFPLIDYSEAEAADEEDKDISLTDADKQNQAKYFYFYQANDGQQVFLNSLNIRILNASWGALAAAPPLLTGAVLHRETLSLLDQTRKHMPYAAHLPLNCSFDIVEIDLKPPYATEAAIKNFSEELARRALARARALRAERRRQRAREPPPRPDLSSQLHFPAPRSPPRHPALPQPGPSPSSVAASSSGLSFAKVSPARPRQRAREPPPRPDLSSQLHFPAPRSPPRHPALPQPGPSPSSVAASSSGLSFAKVSPARPRQRAREPPPRPDLSSQLHFPAPRSPPRHPALPQPGPSPSSVAASSSGLSFAKVSPARPRQRAREPPPRPDLSSQLHFPAPRSPPRHPALPQPGPSPSSVAASSSGLSFAKVSPARPRQRAREPPPRPDLSSQLHFPAPRSPPRHPALPQPGPSPSSVAASSSGLSFAKVSPARPRQRAREPPPRPDLSSQLHFPAPRSPPRHPALPQPGPSPSSVAASSSGLSFAKVSPARPRQRAREPPPRPDLSSQLHFPAPRSPPRHPALPQPGPSPSSVAASSSGLSFAKVSPARPRQRAREPPPRPDLSSQLHFPAPRSPPRHPALPQPGPSPSSVAASSSGLSFAKMAGTCRVRKASPPPAPRGEPADPGAAPAPRAPQLRDAIEAALQAAASSPAPAPSGKKNKKSKHKVLFATGMHRAA